jgi:hypothetical protein
MTEQATDGHGHGHGPRNTAAQPRRQNDLHQLDVYRCALQLYRAVRRIVAQFPGGEADLQSQMRRASRSIPFNIGEGVGKRGKARVASRSMTSRRSMRSTLHRTWQTAPL